MARTKKVEQKEETQAQENNNNKEINLSSNSSIVYKGSVKIQIKKGNRIISNTTKRNRGTNQMFKYLAYCLYGVLVENLAPNYVVLLKKGTDSQSNIIHKVMSNPRLRSEKIIEGDIVSYKFLIPYNAIVFPSTAVAEDYKIDEVALINAQNIGNFTETVSDVNLDLYASAVIELSNNGNNDERIDIKDLGNDDAIVIVWSMQIKDVSQGGNS